jgi:hypothetical protein
MSTKSYRFILRSVYKKSYGEVTGPFHADGRVIVPVPGFVPLVGGPESGICVDEVNSGVFREVQPIKELPALFLKSRKLVVSEEIRDILLARTLGPGIGLLPVTILSKGKVIANYSWVYAKQVVLVPSDVPNEDIVLLEHMDWLITDELRSDLVAIRATGVEFEQVGM